MSISVLEYPIFELDNSVTNNVETIEPIVNNIDNGHYNTEKIFNKILDIFLGIENININRKEKETKYYNDYEINYKIDFDNNNMSINLKSHETFFKCKSISNNKLNDNQMLIFTYINNNNILAFYFDENHYYISNEQISKLLKPLFEMAPQSKIQNELNQSKCLINGKYYHYKEEKGAKYVYGNMYSQNHQIITEYKLKIYIDTSFLVCDVYNLENDKKILCFQLPILCNNIKLIETRYDQSGIKYTQMYFCNKDENIEFIDQLLLTLCNQFNIFKNDIEKIEKDELFVKYSHKISAELENILKYSNIFKDINFIDAFYILNDHLYQKKSYQELLMYIKEKYSDNFHHILKIIDHIVISRTSQDETIILIKSISELIKQRLLNTDIDLEKEEKLEIQIILFEHINNELFKFFNKNKNEIMIKYDNLVNNAILNSDLINHFNTNNIEHILNEIYSLFDTDYVPIDDILNIPENFEEYDEELQLIIPNIVESSNYKYEENFTIEKDNEIHKYIITFGNSQMTSKKEIITHNGEIKSYTKEKINSKEYEYMKIGEGKSKSLVITENKNINNKYGYDGYKAGVTADGKPCIIILRILPDSIVACDPKMTKYRTNKCVVKNIIGVNMQVTKVSDQYKYQIDHNITLNDTTIDGICPICCTKEASQVARPCNHNVCLDCWIKIIHNKDDNNCPFCRQKVQKIDYIPNYKKNLKNNLKYYNDAYSIVSSKITHYKVGHSIEVDNFNKNLDAVCCNGIHYHLTIEATYKWFEYLLIPDELKDNNAKINLNNDISIKEFTSLEEYTKTMGNKLDFEDDNLNYEIDDVDTKIFNEEDELKTSDSLVLKDQNFMEPNEEDKLDDDLSDLLEENNVDQNFVLRKRRTFLNLDFE